MTARRVLVPAEQITRAILVIRGRKVLLDAELAAIYGVTTKRLNEQVRRNRRRFPPDFMFQLSAQEAAVLKSQSATSKPSGRGGRRYLPNVFTEHGAIMAATVLEPFHPGLLAFAGSPQRRSLYTPCACVTGDSAVLISAADRGPIER